MSGDDSNNYLYIGRYLSGEIGYVGIGGVTRPYGQHNPEADEVLQLGDLWISDVPFSTRRDAEMAESLLIRALTWATEKTPRLTNIAKVSGSSHLSPALKYKDGRLSYSEVSNALFVKIRPGALKGRSAPNGPAGDLDLAMRCNRWWNLGSVRARGDDVQLLVAVTAGTKPPRVVGAWEAAPVSDWWYEDQAHPERSPQGVEIWNGAAPLYDEQAHSGWVVSLRSSNPDMNGWQGLELDWEDYRLTGAVGYSADLRANGRT